MIFVSERHRPRKRFGQHFLTDPHIADRIVAAAAPGEHEPVLEIGPGRGVLTERLLQSAGDVWAVELDRDLIPILRDRFGGDRCFHLIESDILAFDPRTIPVEGRIRVVANIPYNITTPIIDYLIRHRAVFSGGVLMMQRERAARLLAGPGSRQYGLASLNFALYGSGRRLFDVAPGSFSPPPEVTSSVVELEIREHCRYPLRDGRMFHSLTGAVFRQRRKMIRNTLIPFLAQIGIPADDAAGLLEETGIPPEARPEAIGVREYVALSNLCGDILARHHPRETGS